MHSAFSLQKFFAKNKTPLVPKPPCGSYLSSADFFLFSKSQVGLKGIDLN
jgi:hypothetical protein